MSKEKKSEKAAIEKGGGHKPDDVPSLFRINVEVGELNAAAKFYEKLLN